MKKTDFTFDSIASILPADAFHTLMDMVSDMDLQLLDVAAVSQA